MTVVSFCLALPAFAEKTADEILKAVDDQATQFKDCRYKMILTVRNTDGTEKSNELFVFQKGAKRLYQFLSPASERGMGFLSLDSENSFVYIPSEMKVRRIAGHVRNQSFMGTDYNYDDMALSRYDEVYSPKMVESTANDYVLDLFPKPDKSSNYSKIRIWIGKDMNAITKLDYYNKKGELEKTDVRSDWVKVKYQWTCKSIELTNVKTNHKSLVNVTDPQYDLGLSDDLFTQRQLKRLEQ